MQLNKEQIVDLLKSRATNYKDYKGIKRAYVPDDDFDYIADKILTLLQPNKDSQPQLQQTQCTAKCGFHSTDWNGKCFICGEQVFIREPK